MTGRSALILGATGLIGSHCLRMALASNDYQRVIVAGRRPVELSDPRLEQRVGNLLEAERLLEGLQADDLFCCLGTTIRKAGSQGAFREVDYQMPLAAGRVMKANGLRHYLLVSAMGANPRSMIFYNRVKGELESELRGLELPALSVFRPSLLTGERQEQRAGEQFGIAVASCISFAMRGPLKNYAAIPGETVARAMLRQAEASPSGTQVLLSGEIADLGST